MGAKSIVTACIFLLALTVLRAQEDSLFRFKNLNTDNYYDSVRATAWGIDFSFEEQDLKNINPDSLLAKLNRVNVLNDSLMKILKAHNIAERSDSLMELYNLITRDTSKSYNAYNIFVGQNHSNLDKLNNSLAAAGWPQLNETQYSFSFFLDFSWKRKRRLHELYCSLATGKSVSKGNESIFYNTLSPLGYRFGYSVINQKRLELFPFGGLQFQVSDLVFSSITKQAIQPGAAGYDSLLKYSPISSNGTEYRLKKRGLILDYGVEIDFHLIYSKRRNGFILGLRGAKTLPLISSGWKMDKKGFPLPEINLNDYHIDLVLKFYWRRRGEWYPINYRE